MKTILTVLFFIASMFFVYGAYSNEDAATWRCHDANLYACPNLTNLEIKIEKVKSFELENFCEPKAKACAVLNFKNKSCTIYVASKFVMNDFKIITHETNHCYGWGHGGKHGRYHDSAWQVFPQLVKYINKKNEKNDVSIMEKLKSF